jgi:hypothetical protein
VIGSSLGGHTITLNTEGNTQSQIITTFSTGLAALNGLTDQIQFFSTGTSGTDFNISSSAATHNFNIPVASAANTGKLSSADWTTFNNKVTSVTATAPLTSSGGATPDISTSIATNRIVGRSTAGTGVMEQLTPVGITVSGGNITGIGGTLGTVDNAVPRADGTGQYTAQGSDIVIDDATTSTQANVAITNQHAGQTNSALVLSPKGSGAVIFGPKPDGGTAGGNARGIYARDFQSQINRADATRVASGATSTIGGGQNNKATGDAAVVGGGYANEAGGGGGRATVAGGYECIATGARSSCSGGYLNEASANDSSILGGQRGLANRVGMQAHASGQFAAKGDAQRARFVLRQATSSATPATLFLDGSSTRLTIPSNKVFGFTVNICGTKQGLGEQAMFVRKGYIKNVAGTTSLIGTIETIGTDIKTAGATTTDVALTADDTNDALQINVIGVTGENWRWVASVDAVEISY